MARESLLGRVAAKVKLTPRKPATAEEVAVGATPTTESQCRPLLGSAPTAQSASGEQKFVDAECAGTAGSLNAQRGATPDRTSSALSNVFRAALSMQATAERERQRTEVHHQAIKRKFWLNGKLMYAAVVQRDGPSSWQATVVRVLQSQEVQLALIALLLLDVVVIFGELFIEAEYPLCSKLRQRAYSCCAGDGTTGAVALPSAALISHAHHATGGDLLAECAAPLHGVVANHVGCWAEDPPHQMHEWLTIGSLSILAVFEVELLVLIAALGALFFRSWAYILDLVIITTSLVIMLFVLQARSHARHSGDSTMVEELQGLILLGRCWRFVRVGHGIALSMYDALHAAQLQMQAQLEELHIALHQMEGELKRQAALTKGGNAAQIMDEVHSLVRQFSTSHQ